MSEFSTNALLFVEPAGPVPEGALGLALAADADQQRILAAWVTFTDARTWVTGEHEWVPADTVEFLTAERYEAELRELHARLRAAGRVVRYLPACGHTNPAAAGRDFCQCSHQPHPPAGAVAVIPAAASGASVHGQWVSVDASHGGGVRVDASVSVDAALASELDESELVALLAGLPRAPWPALLAMQQPGVSNPQQELLDGNAHTIMPGVVMVGERAALVIAQDGDELIVHMLGATTARADTHEQWRLREDRDPVDYHAGENRWDPEQVTVIARDGALGRVSKSLTRPVTLTDWLAQHDAVIAAAEANGVETTGW